jgi:hypothetical protein
MVNYEYPRGALENRAYKARCKAAAAPNPGTILVKKERCRDEQETQETDEGARPIDAELDSRDGCKLRKIASSTKVTYVHEHLGCKKGESGGDGRSDHGVGGKSRGTVLSGCEFNRILLRWQVDLQIGINQKAL